MPAAIHIAMVSNIPGANVDKRPSPCWQKFVREDKRQQKHHTRKSQNG